MVGKRDQASYSRLKRKRGKNVERPWEKIGWNIKPVGPYVFPQVFDLSGLRFMKLRSIGKSITSANILKNQTPACSSFLLPSQPRSHLPSSVNNMSLFTCWRTRSLRVFVTVMFWLFVYSAQTLSHLWHTDIEMKWYVGKSRLPL